MGDFEGLMRRLDYSAGLGVTALCLSPFQPSSQRDDGYDTTEHPAVQEEIRKIMGFRLELGVSGFRVDAVPFIIETIPGQGSRLMRFDYL